MAYIVDSRDWTGTRWRHISTHIRTARQVCWACIIRLPAARYGNCAIGALGIMPYISATIIMQLLTAVWPRLSKLAREEGGRAKIIQYGRYLTVLLCIGQGLYLLRAAGKILAKVFGLASASLCLIDNHILVFISDGHHL